MSKSHIDQINAIVQSRSEELVGLLESFIRIPSENPPGTHLQEGQAWVGETLAAYDIPFETHHTSRTDTDHAVIIGTVGSGEPFVYFHGHYDVVPAFAEAQYVPEIRDGSVFGRGASDMKGGVVAMLLAVVIHRDLGGGGQVRLVYVPDEESGGADEPERMTELGLVDPAGCVGAIVGEPSFPDIWYAARGAFTVEVTVSGRPAHVGLHYTGDSAFERAHQVIAGLLSWRDSVASRKTDFSIEPEAARSSIVLIGGTSGGGTNFNIVPDEFRFTIDRRLSVDILQDARPASTPPDDLLGRSVRNNVTRTSGRTVTLSTCPGCLETRIYRRHGASPHSPTGRVRCRSCMHQTITSPSPISSRRAPSTQRCSERHSDTARLRYPTDMRGVHRSPDIASESPLGTRG